MRSNHVRHGDVTMTIGLKHPFVTNHIRYLNQMLIYLESKVWNIIFENFYN